VNLDGFALPVKKLKGTDPVETLDLSSKNLGVASAVVIASLISVNGALTSLDLSSNWLCGLEDYGRGTYTAEGITAIADALRVNGRLTKISLANNRLGEEGTKAICEALGQNKMLKELDISGEQDYGSNIGGTAGVKHVTKMLGVNGGLTKISLARNHLEEEGTKAICEALEQNTTLKELDISGGTYDGDMVPEGNIGGSAGAKHVAKMLGVNGSLTKINVSWNSFGPKGAKVFADALRVNGALTSVELMGNKLGDKGWGAIFAAICGSKDSKIMSLDAFSENISPAGGKLIAEALRTSVTGVLTQVLAF
jgi:hypothetical protein